jgi:hypothetical protein
MYLDVAGVVGETMDHVSMDVVRVRVVGVSKWKDQLLRVRYSVIHELGSEHASAF